MTTTTEIDVDSLPTTGNAIAAMLSDIDLEKETASLRKSINETKSMAKKDAMVKKLKYLMGLRNMGTSPAEAYTIRHIPITPPIVRPHTMTGGGRAEFADVNNLYKDLMTANTPLKSHLASDDLTHELLQEERGETYGAVKAAFGLGEAVSGNSRGRNLKGYIRQISGETGPKGGFFHSKLLSKKQDFSGRATIYAEPNLGFNEAAVPKDMLWTMYEFHIIRDLVKNGYDYVSAKKAVEERSVSATNSFNKLIKQIPVILNRAPTLMRTNVTAHFPVPIEGKTLGINPLHLPMYAGDYDGDALTVHVPMTAEAIEEAKKKLLPSSHIYDYRKGLGASMVAPGHEAIIGSMHLTEPDMGQKPVHFKTEEEVLEALKNGEIKENTPIQIG